MFNLLNEAFVLPLREMVFDNMHEIFMQRCIT